MQKHNIEMPFYDSGFVFFLDAYTPPFESGSFSPGWFISYDNMTGFCPLSFYVSLSGEIVSSNIEKARSLIKLNQSSNQSTHSIVGSADSE